MFCPNEGAPGDNKGCYIVACGAVLMLAGVFLPFIGVSIFDINGYINYLGNGNLEGVTAAMGKGIILLGMAGLLILLLAFHLLKGHLRVPLLMLAGVTGLLGLLLPLLDAGQIKSRVKDAGFSFSESGYYWGLGFWLILLAGAVLLAGVMGSLCFRTKRSDEP